MCRARTRDAETHLHAAVLVARAACARTILQTAPWSAALELRHWLLIEHVAQDRLGGVSRRLAELLLDRAPELVPRGRGDHAPRERARDLLADLSAARTLFAADVVQLEVGQMDALAALDTRARDEDLAARERELPDREALRLSCARAPRACSDPREIWRVRYSMFDPPSARSSKFTTESPTWTCVTRNGCSPTERALIASSIAASVIASSEE